MSVNEERKALDRLSGSYRRLITGRRPEPPAEPPPDGQAPPSAAPQRPKTPSEPPQPPAA